MPLITRKNNTGFKISSEESCKLYWTKWLALLKFGLCIVSITSNGIAKHQRNDFNSVLIED